VTNSRSRSWCGVVRVLDKGQNKLSWAFGFSGFGGIQAGLMSILWYSKKW